MQSFTEFDDCFHLWIILVLGFLYHLIGMIVSGFMSVKFRGHWFLAMNYGPLVQRGAVMNNIMHSAVFQG